MKMIVANLKNYLSYNEIKEYATNDLDVIYCVPSIFVDLFSNKKVGLQDISMYDKGAYTGEVIASCAKEMGINYVILGHSERRKYNFEIDEIINKKVIKSLDNNLNVILCIGEELGDDRNEKLKEQLLLDLKNVQNIENLIIAYEPIWCIGTGVTPKNQDIEAAISLIKTIISEKYNQSVKVLYGGSVDDKNINTLIDINNIDGFLIGKSATDYNKLRKIVDVVNRQN